MSIPQYKERDLTSGSLHRNIWYLAIPMILETGIQNVSQLLDTYWVSKLGSTALAAVTISTTIRWVLNSLSNGLGIGGMAIVARRIGEKDKAAANHAMLQTIILGIVIALGISITGFLVSRPLLILLGADNQVLPLGLDYLHITFGGLFTITLVFVINAMLRGAGEAKKGMNALFIATAVTVVLEPLLVFGWGLFPPLGVAGSALASILGFGTGLGYQFYILLSGKAKVGIDLRHFSIDFPLIKRIIHIAIPSTTQMVLRSSSRLVIISFIGAFGTYALAGYGVANRMLLIVFIPTFGLANAASTLVGQNLGAKKPARAERSAWWVSAYGVIYITLTTTFLFAYAPQIVRFFDATPEVVEIGTECLRYIAPSMIISVIGLVMGRSFDGAGDTVPVMVVNLFSLWGIEILLSYALIHLAGLGVVSVWWGRAIANIANGIILIIWFKLGRWKKREV